MIIEENAVAKGRRSLAKLHIQHKPGITSKSYVLQLTPEIHARLSEGHKMEDIWRALVEPLPAGNTLSLKTFRRYWQLSRPAVGLEPLKRWTRRTKPKAQPKAPRKCSPCTRCMRCPCCPR